jgi:putative addiction module component (TIGR02574 family)
MTIAEIKEMSVNQRIILMEEIWETLSNEDVDIESPTWHKEVLDERMKLIDSGKAEYLTIEQLKSS